MSITRKHLSARSSAIVIHNDTIYLSGQVAEGADIQEQTRIMLGKVDKLLEEAGSSKSHILQAVIWLSTMENFAAMNEVWNAWIDPENPPARACGEAKLAREELLVEVIITAAKS